jgi:hypothetical protein
MWQLRNNLPEELMEEGCGCGNGETLCLQLLAALQHKVCYHVVLVRFHVVDLGKIQNICRNISYIKEIPFSVKFFQYFKGIDQ